MSDLVKAQSQQPSTTTRKQREQKIKTKDVEATKFDTTTEEDLTGVAIAAADAPFAKAYSAYSDRFASNLKDFQTYVKNSQQKVSEMLKQSILDVYGLDESAMYGDQEDGDQEDE